MISDWELWACANQVLKIHGEKAPRYVAEQIGALALTNDAVGIAAWKAIADRIAELAGLIEPGSITSH